jgi:hypothetical protein
MKKIFVASSLALSLFASTAVHAQSSTTSGLTGFRRGLATVMFAGLGGAVLGLSTLSFYGEPQEHIGNIWTGLALGVLGGTAYIASQPSTTMALNPVPLRPMEIAQAPIFQMSFEF